MSFTTIFVFIAIVWALVSFQKKILLRNFNYYEVGLGNVLVIILISLFLYPFLIKMKILDFSRLINTTTRERLTFLFCGLLLFSTGLGVNYLLSKRPATTIMPMLQSGLLFFTLLFGCIVYRENITFKKVIASILAITAIVILYDEK